MSRPPRRNVRTWLLLSLALIPTVAVFIGGVVSWRSRTADIERYEAGLVPIETTHTLFTLAMAIDRTGIALATAAEPDASDELIAIAADELDHARALVAASADEVENLVSELTNLEGDPDRAEVTSVLGEAFQLANQVLARQEAGRPPTPDMAVLVGMGRDNVGGLVLAYGGGGSNDVAVLYESMATTIGYWDAFHNDRVRLVAELLDTEADINRSVIDRVVDSPIRSTTWRDLIDARQFDRMRAESFDWQLSHRDPSNGLFFVRDEPLQVAVETWIASGEDATARDRLLLDAFAVDQAVRADIEMAYGELKSIADADISALRTERKWIALGTLVVSLVGVALLQLTVAEIRHRRRVEQAHADAIRQLNEKADRDPATQAWNRRRLERILTDLLRDTAERGTHVALAYVDLDSFKAINDVWGHHTGDQILRIVTNRLTDFTHDGVGFELARFGGDEFVLYGEVGAVGQHWLSGLGTKLLGALESPMVIAGREHAVGASVGLAMSVVDSTLDSLLLEADSSLILAKRTQRGTAIVYDRTTSRTGELVHALPHALSSGEITCHLQPVYDATTGRIIRAEALARWFRPSGEAVSPTVFVPLVESFGLADRLTSQMLHNIATLIDSATIPHDVRVWLNLSPRELEVANFAARFAQALAGAGVAPKRIGIEITETAAIRDPRAFGTELQAMREQGIGIAIDDFGNGYSPLGFIRDLPIDIVKLDRSLIHNIHVDPSRQWIVRGIVGMLVEMGIGITAEGVEREPEQAWLVANGVDAIQGYLRAAPMDPRLIDWSVSDPLVSPASLG